MLFVRSPEMVQLEFLTLSSHWLETAQGKDGHGAHCGASEGARARDERMPVNCVPHSRTP